MAPGPGARADWNRDRDHCSPDGLPRAGPGPGSESGPGGLNNDYYGRHRRTCQWPDAAPLLQGPGSYHADTVSRSEAQSESLSLSDSDSESPPGTVTEPELGG